MLSLKGQTVYSFNDDNVCEFDLHRIVLEASNADWNSTRSLFMFGEKGKFEGLFRIRLEIRNLETKNSSFSSFSI